MPREPITKDLNEAMVYCNLEGASSVSIEHMDNKASDDSVNVECFFRDIECHLIDQIKKADAVVGCVAWLTSDRVLDELAKKDQCCFIVCKEDFVSPYMGDDKSEKLRGLYKCLPGFDRSKFDIAELYDTHLMPFMDSIRVVGDFEKYQRQYLPRMHNKFAVFFRSYPTNISVYEDAMGASPSNFRAKGYEPYAVWTGSFNFTKNASKSLENAVLISSKRIANAYEVEFGTILGLSEPYTWTDNRIAPELSLGEPADLSSVPPLHMQPGGKWEP